LLEWNGLAHRLGLGKVRPLYQSGGGGANIGRHRKRRETIGHARGFGLSPAICECFIFLTEYGRAA
jgi:hypothetical protein